MVTVLCTVRNCRLPLAREERRMVCANAHSFDVARSGYVNLLQPQDRRSKTPGDSREAVAARRRFLDAGYERPILDAILAMLGGAPAPSPAKWRRRAATAPSAEGTAGEGTGAPLSPALDVACGEGTHLAAIAAACNVEAHGVDLSAPAIDLAARRHPQCRWVVANADRFLPYGDDSFALVTSISGRTNPAEFRRVMKGGGNLLVAITASDDLAELRAIIHDEANERDRVDRTVAMFAEHFALERRERACATATLDRNAIGDLLASTYRGIRHREKEKVAGVDTLEVTLSRDLLLFRAI